MLHDNSKPCVGLNGPGSTSRHVMAPVMAHVDPEEPWSPCSARFITDFLDNGYGRQTSRCPWCNAALLPLCSLPLRVAAWTPRMGWHSSNRTRRPGRAAGKELPGHRAVQARQDCWRLQTQRLCGWPGRQAECLVSCVCSLDVGCVLTVMLPLC